MAERFYLNCPLQAGPIQLQGAEAHHLAAVCRFRAGDQVYLFNGDGSQYLARITCLDRSAANLEVLTIESPARELPFRLEVAAPLPKGDRAAFLIEKLTELGVGSFTPLRTERTIVQAGAGKLAKLQRTVIEASKQCGRNVLLRVQTPVDWPMFCRSPDLPAKKFIAHPGGEASFADAGEDVVVAVGPEGGFTDDEVDLARHSGWRLVDLGPRTLRIETATIMLAAWTFQRQC